MSKRLIYMSHRQCKIVKFQKDMGISRRESLTSHRQGISTSAWRNTTIGYNEVIFDETVAYQKET